MELKTAVENDEHDDILNEIDKFLLKEPKPEQTTSLMFNKLIAYIKLNQKERAHEYLKNNLETFKEFP